MQNGRVVSDMPSVLVDPQDLKGRDGGEVVIVRRTMERISVDDARFYTARENEFGQPALMPLRIQAEINVERGTPSASEKDKEKKREAL